jgi:AcrR family transcriptional regulator
MDTKPAESEPSNPAVDRLPPRQRILAVARDLFYERGVRAVGVDEIAEAAGTNKMTLYRHFASKDLLVAECYDALPRQNCSRNIDRCRI